MFLYTIILELQGGTYVSQTRGISERAAVELWTQSLDERIPQVTLAHRRGVAQGLNLEELTPLSGLINAWCSSALVDDQLALLNIIRTDDSE